MPMPAPVPVRKRSPLRRFVWIAAISIAAGAVVYGSINAIQLVRGALRMEKHVRETAPLEPAALAAWQAAFGDPKALRTAFPKLDDDARATELSRLAKGLGIEFARKPSPPSDGIVSEVARKNEEPFRSLGDYDNTELPKSGGPIAPLPPVVANFLREKKGPIEDVVSFLAEGSPPGWAMNTALGPEAPVPNLLAIIRLHRVLATEALVRFEARDAAGAERALRAAWNLERSLRDRPEVLTQLIAISLGRRNAALVRRLAAPDEWLEKLAQHDYRRSLLQAMVTEVVGEFDALPRGASPFERASRADFLNLTRKALVRLRDSRIAEIPRRQEREERSVSSPLSVGEILADVAVPSRADIWIRVDQLILENEFTEKVLRLKKLRADGGRWPVQVPGIEASRAAVGRWTYAVDEKGRMSLAFSKDPEWVYQHGFLIPLRYESD